MLKTVIGLEIHCELKSKSKVFSSGQNKFSEEPNSYLSEIDLGYPGILPTLNKDSLRKAIQISTALNCTIAPYMIFDRKNYYYPDLPKGYQITQLHHPVGTHGYLEFYHNGEVKKVLISDLHLEEDTANMDHFPDCSYINYNRAGVPLIEMVTEPCIYSADEAISFLESLRSVIIYCGASDVRLDKGELRCDVNVNLQDETGKYVTPRVEVKNVNSFANIKETILYEVKRQTEAYNNHEELRQETRRFDSDTNTTITMRTKENAIDYKYYIEPNIPPIKITEELKEDIKSTIPKLQLERIKTYVEEYGLNLVDAIILVRDKSISDYYDEVIKTNCNKLVAASYVITRVLGALNKDNIALDEFFLTSSDLGELLLYLEKGLINSNQAKEAFNLCLEERLTPKEIISKYNMEVIDDDNLINELVDKIINDNSDKVEEYHNGKTNLLGYFVGQVIKESGGKLNPAKIKEKVIEKL